MLFHDKYSMFSSFKIKLHRSWILQNSDMVLNYVNVIFEFILLPTPVTLFMGASTIYIFLFMRELQRYIYFSFYTGASTIIFFSFYTRASAIFFFLFTRELQKCFIFYTILFQSSHFSMTNFCVN